MDGWEVVEIWESLALGWLAWEQLKQTGNVGM